MSDLVVIAFPTEAKAEEVRQKLLAMQKEYLIELGDAVIAVKDKDGHIKLNQLLNTTAVGAVSGTFWGTLIGLIFLMPLAGGAIGAGRRATGGAGGGAPGACGVPLTALIVRVPRAGAAVGAASGAIGGALSDVGINDKWIKE